MWAQPESPRGTEARARRAACAIGRGSAPMPGEQPMEPPPVSASLDAPQSRPYRQSREFLVASRQPWSWSCLQAPDRAGPSPPQCAQKPAHAQPVQWLWPARAGFEHIVGRARRAKRGAGGQSAGQAGREDRVRKEVMTQPSPDLADSTCQESYPLRYGGRPSMRSVGGRVSGPGDLAPKPTQ